MGWKNSLPSSFANTVIKDCETNVKKTAAIGLQSVITGSPVQDGHYRGSHKVTINREDYSFDEQYVDKQGTQTQSTGMANIVQFKLGDTLFIQTNAPHASRLEKGWSKQAPLGVYSIAFMNMRNAI